MSSENISEVELPVDFPNGDTIILKVTLEEAQRAYNDQTVLQSLLDRHNENLSRQTVELLVNEAGPSSSTINLQEATGSNDECAVQERWDKNAVLLFLSVYKEKEKSVKYGQKNAKFWNDVSAAMTTQNSKIKMTGAQCSTKMSGLKRQYKTCIDHNNKSGNDRKTNQFFDEMDDIFGQRPWVKPIALATEAGSFGASSSASPSERENKKKENPVKFWKNSWMKFGWKNSKRKREKNATEN